MYLLEKNSFQFLLWSAYFFTSIYGHVALKYSHQTSGGFSLFSILTDFWILSAGVSWVASAVIWYLILAKSPLLNAASINSLSYVFLFIATVLIVKEPIRSTQIIGSIFIIVGTYLVVR